MTRVWKYSPQSGSKLLCLLALADFANDKNQAFPAVSTLAKKTRMSSRNVQRALEVLADCGEIEIEKNAGPGGCNVYRLRFDHINGGDNLSGGVTSLDQICQGGGDAGVVGGVTPVSPKPSYNRQYNRQGTCTSSKYMQGVTSFHQEFTEGWVSRYKEKFGTNYLFDGGKDGKAVKELNKTGKTVEELLELAMTVWNLAGKDEWLAKTCYTIAGFKSQFNRVQAMKTSMANGDGKPLWKDW